MRYLFFDLECATHLNHNARICEFGYVVTDENFKVLQRDNYIINPNIKLSAWDKKVVSNILTKPISEYIEAPLFLQYYAEISSIIKSSDYIFGHSMNGDAMALNIECLRYGLPSIDFFFYDIKLFYKTCTGTKKDTSVINIIRDLGVSGDNQLHDAEADAYNTMLGLREMLNKQSCSVEEMIELCPEAYDSSKNYEIESFKLGNMMTSIELWDRVNGKCSNLMNQNSFEYRFFRQYANNIMPHSSPESVFNGKCFTVSPEYEENHYHEMLCLIDLLAKYGGKYATDPRQADLYIDVPSDDHNSPRFHLFSKDIDIDGGKAIIPLAEVMMIINLSETQLTSLPLPSFDCMFSPEAVISDSAVRKLIKKQYLANLFSDDEAKITIGDLFGDVLKKAVSM